MPFGNQHYPPETLAMMSRVLDECVGIEFGGQLAPDPIMVEGVRMRFAQIILGAVASGEMDPIALKKRVLIEAGRLA
jgi:hypothetical protein